jgi:hypothetical protein
MDDGSLIWTEAHTESLEKSRPRRLIAREQHQLLRTVETCWWEGFPFVLLSAIVLHCFGILNRTGKDQSSD